MPLPPLNIVLFTFFLKFKLYKKAVYRHCVQFLFFSLLNFNLIIISLQDPTKSALVKISNYLYATAFKAQSSILRLSYQLHLTQLITSFSWAYCLHMASKTSCYLDFFPHLTGCFHCFICWFHHSSIT